MASCTVVSCVPNIWYEYLCQALIQVLFLFSGSLDSFQLAAHRMAEAGAFAG